MVQASSADSGASLILKSTMIPVEESITSQAFSHTVSCPDSSPGSTIVPWNASMSEVSREECHAGRMRRGRGR